MPLEYQVPRRTRFKWKSLVTWTLLTISLFLFLALIARLAQLFLILPSSLGPAPQQQLPPSLKQQAQVLLNNWLATLRAPPQMQEPVPEELVEAE